MKKTILLLLFLTIHHLGNAQCGVQPSIKIGIIFPSNYSDAQFDGYMYSQFQPGWQPFNYVWKIDGSVVNNNSSSISGTTYFSGYHEVCLTIFAHNPSTGDSCDATVCNIFSSVTGDAFTSVNAQEISPLTVQFTPETYAGQFSMGSTPSIPVVDTILYNSPYIYTFDSAGTYTYKVWSGCFQCWGGHTEQIRTINVTNNTTNFVVNQATVNVYNDSIYITPSTSYPVTLGQISLKPINYIFNYYSGATSPTFSHIIPAPGLYLAQTTATDSLNNTFDSYSPFIVDFPSFTPDTITGIVFNDDDADGILDSNEFGIPGEPIKIGYYSAITDSNGFYSILVPHDHVAVSLGSNYNQNRITFPSTGTYYVFFTSGITHSNYNFGIADLTVQVCGKTYVDYNQDSIYTSGTDQPFNKVTIHAYNSINGVYYHTAVNGSGNYCIDLPAGNYKFWASSYGLDAAYYVPDTIYINSTAGSYSNNNFGFYSTQQGGNIKVRLSGPTLARPGFPFGVAAIVTNSGIDTTQALLTMHIDSTLILQTIYPANGVVDSANYTITWNTGKVGLTDRKSFGANFTIPATTPLGTVISNTVLAVVDSGYIENYLQNNSTGHICTIVGSLDPNDKQVTIPPYDSTGGTPENQRLYYRINFQNVGTASAINVIVQDVIDSTLDMNTFAMESASHTYKQVSNNNTLTWKFFNINLPDSITNEPQSHGFIEYSILPKQGQSPGTAIRNNANIYFDFNAPIQTNTTTNTIRNCSDFDLATSSVANTLMCVNDTLNAIVTTSFPMYTAWYIDSVLVSTSSSLHYAGLGAGNHILQSIASNGICSENLSYNITIVNPTIPVINTNGNLISTTASSSTYQWYLNDTIINGATQSSYTILLSGLYKVCIGDSVGCIVCSDTVYVSPVGITELNKSLWNISPNPVKDKIFLHFTSSQNQECTFEMFDATGKKVYTAQLKPNELSQEFDLSSLSNGVYSCVIKRSNIFGSRKLVILH